MAVDYEGLDVESGDKIRFDGGEVHTVSGKGDLDGQVCFKSGFSLAPYIVANALESGEMEVL